MTSIKSSVESFLESTPNGVTIVAVTKTVSIEMIKEAIHAGITNIGENKVQEAEEKFPELYKYNLKWHLIGRLQTNKVKKALKIFDLIHSVDRIDLARFINSESEKINKVQDVLLQINTSLEESKAGFFPDDENLINLLKEISFMRNIKVKGLMTIGANTTDTLLVKESFFKLKVLKDKINDMNFFSEKLNILSMGMTNDYHLALEEGSNMIRVGRALFGDRK
ncbi:MAG: YggS family pyridoxal phosphate-dependent enzyme [Cyanobacteriota bacterium]